MGSHNMFLLAIGTLIVGVGSYWLWQTYQQMLSPVVFEYNREGTEGYRVAHAKKASNGPSLQPQEQKSFAKLVREGTVVSEFHDVEGNQSIAAVDEFEHPPASMFKPSKDLPAPRGGDSSKAPVTLPSGHDDQSLTQFLHCSSDKQCGSGRCDKASGKCICPPHASGSACHLPASLSTSHQSALGVSN